MFYSPACYSAAAGEGQFHYHRKHQPMRNRTIFILIFVLFWAILIATQVYQDWLYTQYDWSKLP